MFFLSVEDSIAYTITTTAITNNKNLNNVLRLQSMLTFVSIPDKINLSIFSVLIVLST